MPFIEIGGTPCDESCAQIGPDQPVSGPEMNRLECQAYIVGLRRKYGPEPANTELRIKTNSHDFGSYREVACFYDATDKVSCDYAFKTENGLQTWHEVGMWPPVTYDDRGNAVLVIRDPDLWIMADNPRCLTEKPVTPA